MSWDDEPYYNGFRLEGSLEKNHVPGNNPIMAYTFFPGHSWLSMKANNLNSLVSDTEQAAKRKQDLMVSVKREGGLARMFDLLKNPRNTLDRKLRIYIFADGNKQWADKTIVFHNIEVKAPKPGTLFGLPILPNFVFTIKYNSVEPG